MVKSFRKGQKCACPESICVNRRSANGSAPSRTAGRVSVFEPPLSETPSTKPQAPEKLQISNAKPQKQMPGQTARRSVFELGAWSLEFGAWYLGSQILKNGDAPRTDSGSNLGLQLRVYTPKFSSKEIN